MGKIIIPNAVKRKSNCTYYINSEGDVIEEGAIPKTSGVRISAQNITGNDNNYNFTDDKLKKARLPADNKLSYNDNTRPEIIGPIDFNSQTATGIRNKTLLQLLQLLQLKCMSPGSGLQDLVKAIMKELKCSQRTAYDYAKTMQMLKG